MHYRLLAVLACFLTCFASAAQSDERWAAYYSDTLPPHSFEPYALVLFDRDRHPALQPLQHRNKLLLARLSISEIEETRGDFAAIQAKKLTLKTGSARAGVQMLDTRRPEWAAYVIEEMIPAILRQGFDGVMLDGLDAPLSLEAASPTEFAGMKTGTIKLVQAVRLHYPHMTLMVNQGLGILPAIASDIDIVLAESAYTRWPDGAAKPELTPSSEYAAVSDGLKDLRKSNPALKIYTLDYWPAEDTATRKRILAAHRANGFVPFVAMPGLQDIQPESP